MKKAGIFLFLASTFATSQSHGKDYSFKELWEVAKAKSLNFQIQTNNMMANDLRKKNALARFLPTVDLQANQGYFGSERDRWYAGRDGTSNLGRQNFQSSLGLVAKETFYDNGTSLIQYDNAKYALSQSRHQHARAAQQMGLDLVGNYNELYFQSWQISVRSDQLELLKRQYRQMADKFQQGLAPKTDYLRFKARVARTELDINLGKNQFLKSLEELKNFLGLETDDGEREGFGLVFSEGPHSDAQVFKLFDRELGDWKREFKEGFPTIDQHFELKIYQDQMNINANLVKLAWRRYLPEVFVQGEYGYTNQDYLGGDAGRNVFGGRTNDFTTNWALSFNVQFNLFDFFQRRRSIEIADLDRWGANWAQKRTLLETKKNMEQLRLDIERNIMNWEELRELYLLEQNNVEALNRQYRLGQASFLDLLTSLENLTSAKLQFIRTHLDLRKQMAAVAYHRGDLYEKLDAL